MHDFAKVLFHYGLIGDSIQDKVKIVCPFHDDLKPSMLVNVQQESYFCFGCNAKGRLIDFVKQIEKCNDLKALKIISDIKRGTAKQNIHISIQKPISNKEAIADAKHYFYTLPDTDWLNMPKDNYLLQRGFDPETLNQLGIKENFNHIYGVVAPMLDMGKFKGYVCRATTSKFNDYEIDRKYLYNKGFSRHNTLVGNYNKPWVVVTEGYLDYAKLIQFGIDNSCAILGWKATDIQISKLQQYTPRIISALDNTYTGMQGTEYLSEYFDVVRFAFPKHRKDIGDLKEYEFNISWQKTIQKIKDGKYYVKRSNKV